MIFDALPLEKIWYIFAKWPAAGPLSSMVYRFEFHGGHPPMCQLDMQAALVLTN